MLHRCRPPAHAAEYRARSERRLGELMKPLPKNKGGGDQRSDHRGNNDPGDRGGGKKADAPASYASMGIDKNLAKAARAKGTRFALAGRGVIGGASDTPPIPRSYLHPAVQGEGDAG
jgi:hypothetical protein